MNDVAVQGLGAVVLIPALAILWVLTRRMKPKNKGGKKLVSFGKLAAVWFVGVGIALTFAGRWLAAGFSWAANWVGAHVGLGDITLPAAVGALIIAAGVLVADIVWDRKADAAALASAAVLPTLFALMLGGAVGETGGAAVEQSAQMFANFVMRAGGEAA